MTVALMQRCSYLIDLAGHTISTSCDPQGFDCKVILVIFKVGY